MGKNQATRADDKRLREFITHCNRGHEFTTENTFWQRKSGNRSCRACASQRDLDRRSSDPKGVRETQRLRMANWRANNGDRDRKNSRNYVANKRAWIDKLKGQLGCGLCPERHISCLEFHHMDPSLKDANVSMALAHWGPERLEAEMAKCVVLCANCHRKFHYDEKQRNKSGAETLWSENK